MTDTSARVHLPVRLLFHDRLAAAIVRAAKAERRLAVVCGPPGGPWPEAFQGLDPAPAIVETFGGWRFAVIEQEEEHDHLSAGIEAGTLGLARFPDHGRDPDVLCEAARRALGGGAVPHHPGPDGADASRALGQAFAEQRCAVHYQPQVAADSGTIVGFEALVRAYGPDGDPLTLEPLNLDPGGRFETTALVDWILERALTDLAGLRRATGRALTMAVNLSLAAIVESDLPARLAGLIEAAGLPGDCLEIEVTEQGHGPSLSLAAQRLAALRGQQVRIALDDFGTGFSTLTLLERLTLDTLKIDRAFVAPLSATPSAAGDEAAQLVTAILALAQARGLKVIAEGVERAEQLEILRRLGCGHYQGNYFSPPVARPDLEALLSRDIS